MSLRLADDLIARLDAEADERGVSRNLLVTFFCEAGLTDRTVEAVAADHYASKDEAKAERAREKAEAPERKAWKSNPKAGQ